jgi:polar amino acid transport system substrate-binding protein
MNSVRSRLCHSLTLGCALLAACGLPRDPDGALERARREGLRVGAAHNPPWVEVGNGEAGGVEGTLVREIARTAGARIQWQPGAESELLMKLKDREIDIVIGGLTDDLPWKTELGFTRVYYEDTVAKKKHVLAVAPGENALLMHVERSLLRQKATVPMLLKAQTP